MGLTIIGFMELMKAGTGIGNIGADVFVLFCLCGICEKTKIQDCQRYFMSGLITGAALVSLSNPQQLRKMNLDENFDSIIKCPPRDMYYQTYRLAL